MGGGSSRWAYSNHSNPLKAEHGLHLVPEQEKDLKQQKSLIHYYLLENGRGHVQEMQVASREHPQFTAVRKQKPQSYNHKKINKKNELGSILFPEPSGENPAQMTPSFQCLMPWEAS